MAVLGYSDIIELDLTFGAYKLRPELGRSALRSLIKRRVYPTSVGYEICGVPTLEFVRRISIKYGISHIPTEQERSCIHADRTSGVVINSPYPTTDMDLLAFLHELGHLQGQQYTFLGIGDYILEFHNEVFAWDRAFRRFKAYNKSLTFDLFKQCMVYLDTYMRNMSKEDRRSAIKLKQQLKDKHMVVEVSKMKKVTHKGMKRGGHIMPFWANNWRTK